MNTTTTLRTRLLTAAAAVGVTLALFHSVALLAAPTALETTAQAKADAVTLASVAGAKAGAQAGAR